MAIDDRIGAAGADATGPMVDAYMNIVQVLEPLPGGIPPRRHAAGAKPTIDRKELYGKDDWRGIGAVSRILGQVEGPQAANRATSIPR
jgi:hypothetical protein